MHPVTGIRKVASEEICVHDEINAFDDTCVKANGNRKHVDETKASIGGRTNIWQPRNRSRVEGPQ
jgi:hypothetical protein